MESGRDRRISVRRAFVSAVATLFLVLTSFFPVPHHASAAALPLATQVNHHQHDPDDAARHDHGTIHHAGIGQADRVSNDCADHVNSQAHGGACCQLSCHAALPAPAAPLALPRLDGAIAGVASIPLAPQRVILLDRPPRTRA